MMGGGPSASPESPICSMKSGVLELIDPSNKQASKNFGTARDIQIQSSSTHSQLSLKLQLLLHFLFY
jgi:hypothetical protein